MLRNYSYRATKNKKVKDPILFIVFLSGLAWCTVVGLVITINWLINIARKWFS